MKNENKELVNRNEELKSRNEKLEQDIRWYQLVSFVLS